MTTLRAEEIMNIFLRTKFTFTILLIFFFWIGLSGCSSTQDDMTGWEKGSQYNKLYNAKEAERLKGVIKKFVEITPLPGMATGTGFILDDEGEETLVHLCPKSFATAKETGLKKGLQVKVKGCFAEIGDDFVFMASKVKRTEHSEFKVRLTSDGTPFWTMSDEQLAKERASQ